MDCRKRAAPILNRHASVSDGFGKLSVLIKICVFVLCLLVFFTVTGNAATIRAFFVGNSFTARNDLPALVKNIAANAENPDTIETGTYTIGSSDLQVHWEDGTAKQRISDSDPWDYIVLQAYWACRSGRTDESFYQHVRLWDGFNSGQDAKSIIWSSWPGDWWGKRDRYTKLVNSCNTIGNERNIPICFVAQSFDKVEAEPYNIDPYLRGGDNHHAHVTGTYLAACSIYITITGKSPVGSTYAPDDLRVAASILQQIAWETYLENAGAAPSKVTNVKILRIN